MLKGKIRMMFLLALTFIGSIIGLKNVDAATEKISAGDYVPGHYYYMHEKGSRSLWEQTSMIIRNSDGAFVYCVQPFVRINSNATYEVTTEDMASVANISYENWKRIEKIAYYGYGYNENGIDHTDIKWYPATQMLIWKVADPTVDSYFTTALRGERDDSVLANEMAEINRLVDSHNTTPNFTNVPSEMVIGNTITINDSNNVLSNYNIENVVGGNVSKNGNSLSITATQVGDITFNLTKNGNLYGEPTRLYYATDSQNVVRRGNIDPIRKPMKIKVFGGTVTPNKLDDETLTNVPQGTESSLEGAVYGIYKEDGTKVGTVTTGTDGRATSDYLPSLGRFYLLEEKPSKGYQLDKNKYYFELTSTNLHPEVQVFEKVISLDFDFTKVYADDKTGIMIPEVGVIFGIYNNKGEEVKRLTTDSQGNIKFKLPYGSYTVKQLTSTKGHEKAEDFTLEVKETGPVVKKVIANAEIRAKLKVVKIDSETKEVIKRSGIKFKIFNIDKNEYVCQNITYPTSQKVCVFETDKNGEFVTPYELSSGRYRLEEVDQIIDEYLWNTASHTFEIGENMKVTTDSEYGIIFETQFSNTRVKGEFNIHKNGEKVVVSNGKMVFVKVDLKGIIFGIYAREDIIHNGKTIYHKGDLVTTVETDSDGNAKYSNMYLGKYFVKELKTLPGYKIDTKEYDFELKYKDQYTPVVKALKEIDNFLVTIDYEFTKTDIVDDKPVEGALMELYTEKGELIYSGYSDKDGKINFTITDSDGKKLENKLPIGRYYILEKEAPKNYLLNEDKIWFEVKENDTIVKSNMKDKRVKGVINIHKDGESFSIKDACEDSNCFVYETDRNLKGIHFGLYAEEDIVLNNIKKYSKGDLVADGYTDEFGNLSFEDLYLGNYVVKELKTIEKYVLDKKEYKFNLEYIDGKTPIIEKSFVLKNYLIKSDLEFTKTDLVDDKPLPNTLIEIYLENSNEDEEDILIYSGYTDTNGKITLKNMPSAKYYILEKEAPEGYVLNEEPMYFEIKENGEVIKANMKDEKIKSTIVIHKISSENETIAGVKVGIFDLDGNLLYECYTDEKGNIELELEYGKYYYQELETVEGYELNSEKIFFEVIENKAIIETTLINIKVPITGVNDHYIFVQVIGTLIMISGIGAIIYAKKRKK